MSRHGIYKIEHVASGRIYVGSAVSLHARWNEHRAKLRRNKHENRRLQNAWNKYGADAFAFSVIEFVINRTDLMPREQHWIDAIQSAKRPNFNLRPDARTMLGFSHSAESRAKMSASQSSRPRGPLSPEHRATLSAKATGRKMHPNTRAAIHAAVTGRKYGPEFGAKLSAVLSGRKRSPEVRARMSLAAKNRTPEHRNKLSQAARQNNTVAYLNTASATAKRLATLRSQEQRNRVSVMFKGRKQSPSHKANIAASKARKKAINFQPRSI